jgi:hypothetical protein
MKTTTTTLAAAAALTALAALATPAQAGLVLHASDAVWATADPFAQCAGDADPACVDPCHLEAVGNACDLARSLANWCDGDCRVGDPSADQDHNLVPDTVEGSVCGRSLARGAALDAQTPATCTTRRHMGGLPDADRDGIPDALEPALCQAQDDNTDLDGSCDASGTDYTL